MVKALVLAELDRDAALAVPVRQGLYVLDDGVLQRRLEYGKARVICAAFVPKSSNW